VIAEVCVVENVDRIRASLDQADLVTECQVDRRDSDLIAIERIDHDTAGFDLTEDHVARQDGHGGPHVIVTPVGHPFFDIGSPMVLGHRGAAGHAPENTLLSFERALALGAHTIESDVQWTADGVPVLIHDATLGRATNGTGRVDALSFEALTAVDAGHAFTIDDRGNVHPDAPTSFAGHGLRVPSLEEAFTRFPDSRFNLEIKADAPAAVACVVDLVARFDRADRTLLTAANDETMTAIREELVRRDVPAATSACVAEVAAVAVAAAENGEPPAEIMALQIPTSFANRPLVTPDLLAFAHAHGIQVHVWTINDAPEMNRLLDLGVDGLVTDFPERAAAVLAGRSDT
jgi:glycerophosphoryl diester phosphodiesterase